MSKNPVRAAKLYCRAARHGDAKSQFSLAWRMTNSRAIERNEAVAANPFAAAAARFGVRSIKDPVQNIRGSMAYLRWLMARFEGDVRLVAAAYNAGEGAVERFLGVPPYSETRLYVQKIRACVAGQNTHPFDSTSPPFRR